MLVLAMEFSRGAQRPFGARDTIEQTGAEAQNGRASGRQTHQLGGFRLRVGGSESPGTAQWAGSKGHSLKTE
jgi:hypothetical protein